MLICDICGKPIQRKTYHATSETIVQSVSTCAETNPPKEEDVIDTVKKLCPDIRDVCPECAERGRTLNLREVAQEAILKSWRQKRTTGKRSAKTGDASVACDRKTKNASTEEHHAAPLSAISSEAHEDGTKSDTTNTWKKDTSCGAGAKGEQPNTKADKESGSGVNPRPGEKHRGWPKGKPRKPMPQRDSLSSAEPITPGERTTPDASPSRSFSEISPEAKEMKAKTLERLQRYRQQYGLGAAKKVAEAADLDFSIIHQMVNAERVPLAQWEKAKAGLDKLGVQ